MKRNRWLNLGGMMASFLFSVGIFFVAEIHLAQAASWYASPSGSGSTCSQASPCALSYVIGTKVVAGDTAILLPGTYTTGFSLNNASKHANLTVTTTPEVISALGTFTRGIPSGTDNRPYLQNATVSINVSGALVQYLRIRGASSPQDSCYNGVIAVDAYPTSIKYNEIWNGCQGIFIYTNQQILIEQNYLHDHGPIPSSYDEMCVLITNWNKDPIATSYTNAVRITNNTLARCSGDGMQENSAQGLDNGTTGAFSYLILDNNDCYDNEEQCFDFKGTPNVKIYGNDIHGNGYGGISDNSAYGSTPNFEIYNNRIYDHDQFAVLTQGGGSNWKLWNNVIYNNMRSSAYNWCAIQLPGDSGTSFIGNTVVNNFATNANSTCGLMHYGSGNNVKNNIFFGNGNNWGNIYSGHSGTPSYNYIYPANGQIGTNAITTSSNPGFVNISGFDFHLLSNSVNVNAGTTVNAPYNLDIEGKTRPVGSAFDIGAFEYAAGTPDTTPPATPTGLGVQ